MQIAMRHPGAYRCATAFAPVSHPSACPWGRKAFGHYFGPVEDAKATWQAWDTTELVSEYGKAGKPDLHIRIDQGGADDFLAEQLLPQHLVAAAKVAGVPVEYHLRDGYDHSYYFIATFIGEHIAHHASYLKA